MHTNKQCQLKTDKLKNRTLQSANKNKKFCLEFHTNIHKYIHIKQSIAAFIILSQSLSYFTMSRLFYDTRFHSDLKRSASQADS